MACSVGGNLYAFFDVVETTCSDSGVAVWVIAVAACVGGLGLIAILFVIIVFSNRKLRNKVLPFKERRPEANIKLSARPSET